jgi:hypothetical protein
MSGCRWGINRRYYTLYSYNECRAAGGLLIDGTIHCTHTILALQVGYQMDGNQYLAILDVIILVLFVGEIIIKVL